MKVRATAKGYATYFRNPGDEFDIDPKQFSSKWMETVDGGETPPSAKPAATEEETLPKKDENPLDHDGDGKAGGSSKPEGDPDELKALRVEYKDVLGKKPFAGWDATTLREKIAVATAE